MRTITVKGPQNLKGSINISGSKNASIPIICASLLNKGKIVLKNVPAIKDVDKLITILRYLGCKIKFKNNILNINSVNINYKPLALKECAELRGSYYLIPVMLYLFKKCEILLPGGCKIGSRLIDEHINIFKAYGYEVLENDNVLIINKANDIKKINYEMNKKSVGASINAIIMALSIDYSVISNTVLEPEALCLIEFLNKLGFSIIAFNNKCVIRKSFDIKNDFKFKIIPDRIEAMTFIIMGLLCGKIRVNNINRFHFKYPLDLLINAGYKLKIKDKYIIAYKSKGKSFDIKTDIYPYFPTDMQPLFGALLATAYGGSKIEEQIFDSRMQIYHDINSIGGSVNVIGNIAYIDGVDKLNEINKECQDLRHSAALMLLALSNGGKISNIEILNRGYDNFFFKIRTLGAIFKLN